MTPRDHALSLLEFTRWYSNNLLKDLPESKWNFQPSPTDNHVLWCMGHLAGTEAWLGGILGFDAKVPEPIAKAYGQHTKPSPTGNPPTADVKRAFEASRNAFVQWLKTTPESALNTNLKEQSGGFFTDPVDAAHKIAWHEGFHFGQVANIRKALALPPSM